MPDNFDEVPVNAAADAEALNKPLRQLDTAIQNLRNGVLAIAQPLISSFLRAQHNHQNAAGGGKLDLSALLVSSGAQGNTLQEGPNGTVISAPASSGPEPGDITFSQRNAKTGWLLCHGQAVSRTTYASLFAAIGIANGAGDGSTTFNLPDGRGRATIGKDNMGGASANRIAASWADTMGGPGGSETHLLTQSELPSHNHDVLDGSTTTPGSDPGEDVAYSKEWEHVGLAGSNTGTNTRYPKYQRRQAQDSNKYDEEGYPYMVTNGGGNMPHNNVQPSIAMNMFIKT